MWENSNYCWVVACKNTWFHLRRNFFSNHRVPLGETDAVSPVPALTGSFPVRCDECGKEYFYKPSDVRRYEQPLPESFVTHPLFRPGGDRRRSERSAKQMRLLVRGGSDETEVFEERTYAVSTSAHGALIGLSANVEVGETLFLTDPRSQKELTGKVVRITVPDSGRAQVGVEFMQPCPEISPLASQEVKKLRDQQRQAS